MAQTYAQLQKQILALEAEAEKLKSAEVPVVIDKIKDLVTAYGITAADIFGSTAVRGGGSARRSNAGQVKYSDANGNTWVGMGKRPQWIRDALAAGRTIEEFASSPAKPRAAKGPVVSKKSKGKQRQGAGKTKYSDGDRTWSGFGPQPGWLKDALAQGKRLEDLKT